MADEVTESDNRKIMRKAIEQASEGDKSARNFVRDTQRLLLGDRISAEEQNSRKTTVMQQNVVLGNQESPAVMSELRRQLVVLLSSGPKQSMEIAGPMLTPLPTILLALCDHPWFRLVNGKWEVTEIALSDVPNATRVLEDFS